MTSEEGPGLEACALRIGLPHELVRTLELLTSAYALVGQDGDVAYSSPRAQTLGLTRRDRIAIAEIRDLCDLVSSDGRTREREMRVKGDKFAP